MWPYLPRTGNEHVFRLSLFLWGFSKCKKGLRFLVGVSLLKRWRPKNLLIILTEIIVHSSKHPRRRGKSGGMDVGNRMTWPGKSTLTLSASFIHSKGWAKATQCACLLVGVRVLKHWASTGSLGLILSFTSHGALVHVNCLSLIFFICQLEENSLPRILQTVVMMIEKEKSPGNSVYHRKGVCFLNKALLSL